MKKILAVVLTMCMVFALAACGSQPNENQPAEQDAFASAQSESAEKADGNSETTALPPEKESSGVDASAKATAGGKTLVAYFSATNNTEGVAQKLADRLGADIYEITPKQPYTDKDLGYGNSGSRTSMERDDPDARPAISGSVENMEQYDVVFVGYPIWWGEAPRIMSTFIESYDFTGKTVIPFCTSGSSGFGNSDSALRSAASGATWLDGRRFSAGASESEIAGWLDGLRLA